MDAFMNCEKAISDEFSGNAKPLPRRTSVLLVDSDSTCLVILSKLLRRFGYEVLTAKRAADAFCIVRWREDELDLILAETHLPDMDKYELLETMGEMSTLPVIVMSADGNEYSMLGALFKGAELYLVKPISVSDVKGLWQFAYRKRTNKVVATEGVGSTSSDETGNRIPNNVKQSHQDAKRKESTEVDKNEEEDNADSSVLKKPKLTWTSELHNKFLQAIRVLGINGAHPKKILEHMNVPGLKKENISSHLQKYRLSLKREQDALGKTVNRDYSESHVALCDLSSIVNLQGGLFQFWELQSMTPCHQPEFGNLEQKNDVNCWMPMPSCGSLHFLNNGEPSYNDRSDCKYGQLAPASNQLVFPYPCSSYADIGITSDGKLVGLHGEEFHKGKLASSNNVDSGLEIAMQLPLTLAQQEAKEQQQLFFPPETSPQDKKDHLDFAYPCSSYADIGITGDEKLVGFHGEEFLKGKLASSNNVDSGLEIAMQLPLSSAQQEAKEQQQLLFPPEPSPKGKEEHDINGAGGVEIEKLFDIKKFF